MKSLLNPWLVKSENNRKHASGFQSKSVEAHILAYEWPCHAHPCTVIGPQVLPIWQKGLEHIRTQTESKISIQQAQARKTAVAIGPISLEAQFGSMVNGGAPSQKCAHQIGD